MLAMSFAQVTMYRNVTPPAGTHTLPGKLRLPFADLLFEPSSMMTSSCV
uniref:Uncharacterized protein n=1 Tax=Anguilla anguilla TaxID=7936 RepID=A0A0E9UMD9_ANGAN